MSMCMSMCKRLDERMLHHWGAVRDDRVSGSRLLTPRVVTELGF